MAEIGLELNRIRQISEEIKGLDQTLISGHFGELDDVLQKLQLILKDDGNVYSTVGRITRNATAISEEIKGSLKSLEVFIDQQIAEYERTDESAYQRLSAVLERISKLLGINFSKLNIDSASSVAAPSAATGLNNGASRGTYVTTGADYSGAAMPFVAAAGAGAMAVGGARTNYGTPYYNQDQIDALRNGTFAGNMQVNTPPKVTPKPITYPADSIPSLTKVYTVGPDGNNTIVWVGEDKRIYDENGDLMTSMYMTKNGDVVQTSIMENFVNMSDKDKYERYRWLYAYQNGLRYEQVKDEYLTPEFKAKCDSGLINEYMPADGTDLQVAKDFRKYADTLVPGSGGNIDDHGTVISPEGVNRPLDTPDKPVLENKVNENTFKNTVPDNNIKNNYGPTSRANGLYNNAEIRGNFVLQNGKPIGHVDPVTGRVTDFQGRPINIPNGIGKNMGPQSRITDTMNNSVDRPSVVVSNPTTGVNSNSTGNVANVSGKPVFNGGSVNPTVGTKRPDVSAVNFNEPGQVNNNSTGNATNVGGKSVFNSGSVNPTVGTKRPDVSVVNFNEPGRVNSNSTGNVANVGGNQRLSGLNKGQTGTSAGVNPVKGVSVSNLNNQYNGINAMFK